MSRTKKRYNGLIMNEKNIVKITVASLLALCFLFLSACGGSEQNEQNPAGTAIEGPLPSGNGAYDGLFTDIIEISVTVPSTDLSAMQRNPDDDTYYQASAVINGTQCSAVGIKTRGNTTYVSEVDSSRYSFKLKFGKFQKGVTLNGLDELYLNNMAYDPSYIREYLAYFAFASLDAAAPLASFAKLTVNGEYYGLYLAVEGIDDSFMKRAFGDNDGSLYKSEKGATLTAFDASVFSLKNGDDQGLKNVSTLIKALSSGEGIEDVLDVSSVLKYAAVIAVLGCEDSYLGPKSENYYLYECDDNLSIVPWDLKLSFGTDGSMRKTGYTIKASLITSSVTDPYYDVLATERPLVSKLLANEKYFEEYKGYIKKLAEFLEKCEQYLPELKETLNDAVSTDTKKFYDMEAFESEFVDGENTLLGFIKARRANILTQICE